MSDAKRRYESPKRRQQADATRRRLAVSARRLFAENGYAATTIAAIARDAGVAVQTFYAIYGSKRAVLLDALVQEVEVASNLPELRREVEASTDNPRRQLRLVVDFNAQFYERAADLLEIVRGAGAADPDLATIHEEGERRRRRGQARVIESWAAGGTLPPGMAVSTAADILWAMTGPDVYRLFVSESGWSVAQYRDWLVNVLERILFGD